MRQHKTLGTLKGARVAKLAETHRTKEVSRVKEVRTTTTDSTKQPFQTARAKARRKPTPPSNSNARNKHLDSISTVAKAISQQQQLRRHMDRQASRLYAAVSNKRQHHLATFSKRFKKNTIQLMAKIQTLAKMQTLSEPAHIIPGTTLRNQ